MSNLRRYRFAILVGFVALIFVGWLSSGMVEAYTSRIGIGEDEELIAGAEVFDRFLKEEACRERLAARHRAGEMPILYFMEPVDLTNSCDQLRRLEASIAAE